MTKFIFTEGQEQNISQVLANKDERVALQRKIFAKFPEMTLLDVKLNIPGPIKNNRYLKRLFEVGIENLEEMLKQSSLPFTLYKKWNKATGCENFYLVNANSHKVKEVAITFEEQTKLNRLFDADVLVKGSQSLISRSSLGKPPRRCFICEQPAKDCSRSRKHSVEELQNYISQLYETRFN